MKSREGYRYYLCVMDKSSRFTWFLPLVLKSDFVEKFKIFLRIVENLLFTSVNAYKVTEIENL